MLLLLIGVIQKIAPVATTSPNEVMEEALPPPQLPSPKAGLEPCFSGFIPCLGKASFVHIKRFAQKSVRVIQQSVSNTP